MGLSIWNIFKVRQELYVTTFWSCSRCHYHFLMPCCCCSCSTIDRSIMLGWTFGRECRHDFKSTTLSGKVRSGWFDEHGRTCGWRATNANGGNVTCGAVSQSSRDCRQCHYHCIWNDLWIIVELEYQEGRGPVVFHSWRTLALLSFPFEDHYLNLVQTFRI